MNARALWLALGGVFFGSAAMFAARANATVAGLPTDFWQGFMLVISASLAVLAVISLLYRPSISLAR